METIKATLWIYRMTLDRSLALLRENWGVVFAPLGYSLILLVATVVFGTLGLIGGILLALTMDACMSSGLFLVENIINARRASLKDFARGFTIYLWDIVMVSFMLWVPMMMVSSALYPMPNGPLLVFFIRLTLYIILNAVPEIIYQTRASGLDLLVASYRFIVENWAEWFAPNVLITLAGFFLLRLLDPIVMALPLPMVIFVMALAFGLFLTYLMIFRGLLFSELNRSNRRARIYKYKVRE